LTPSTVIGRLLMALGLSLILAGLVGVNYAQTSPLEAGGSQFLEENYSLVVAMYSMSSNGTAVVKVWNASQVFYVSDLLADPRSLLHSLSTFNINLSQSSFQHVFRLGVVYGTAIVKANRQIISALPGLSTVLKFNIRQAQRGPDGTYTVTLHVRPGTAFMVFIVGREGVPVRYYLKYQVVGAERLDSTLISASGLALVGVGAVLYRSMRPVTLLGENVIRRLRGRVGGRPSRRG